jgi:hypothetical protein
LHAFCHSLVCSHPLPLTPLLLLRARSLESDLGGAAAEATASLRRTRALMAAELGRGAATLSTMGTSTATLSRAHTEFASQRGALAAGRRLLGALTRAATADALVLWAGTALFCLVVAHIALKRVPLLTPLHPLYQLRRRRAAALAQGKAGAPAAVVLTQAAGAAAAAVEAQQRAPPPPVPPPAAAEAPAAQAEAPRFGDAATAWADAPQAGAAAAAQASEGSGSSGEPAAEADTAAHAADAPPARTAHDSEL